MTMFSINGIQQAFNGTYTGTRTGTVTDATQGAGTFSDTVSHQNGLANYDNLITYANGNTQETKTSITQNANGGFDETIQRYVDGKAVKSVSLTTDADASFSTKSVQLYNAKGTVDASANEVITGNADGSESVTGTATWANGGTGKIAGSLSQSGGDVDTNITVTNSADQTSIFDWNYSKTGNVGTDQYTNTNFAGTSTTDTTTITPAKT